MGFFKFIRSLFCGKDLADHLNETIIIKCHDIRFRIRRISPLDYMNGSKVMMETFAKYKISEGNAKEINKVSSAEIKAHYTDVFMSGIVNPTLSRTAGEAGTVFVDNLFTDWGLANDLYGEIMLFTYGKKKSKPSFWRVMRWLSSILFVGVMGYFLLSLLDLILRIFS